MNTWKEALHDQRESYDDHAATVAVRDLFPPFASIKLANEMRKLRTADTLQKSDRAASRDCRTSKALRNRSVLSIRKPIGTN
jgi:hypothetical protein